jgi:transcriptional regulator with XRE-family HTH domain
VKLVSGYGGAGLDGCFRRPRKRFSRRRPEGTVTAQTRPAVAACRQEGTAMRASVLIGPGQNQARPKPLLRTTLGQILRRARRGQGRTLADVARAARVSMPYLSELERGRKEASSEVLAAVCDALRIELSDLLAEAGRRLADERARRALIEERARRRKERAGELPPDITERPAGVPAVTADKAGAAGPAGAGGAADRAAGLSPIAPPRVPVVIPLDAVRSPRIPSAGGAPGDAQALAA